MPMRQPRHHKGTEMITKGTIKSIARGPPLALGNDTKKADVEAWHRRPDPACYDQEWLDWVYAWAAGEAPNVTKPGFAYMYQGWDDASNTDPAATEPAPGEARAHSGPHVMVVLPASVDLSGLRTVHGTADPWVMWAGTPYEHIMMPEGATSDLPDMPAMPVEAP